MPLSDKLHSLFESEEPKEEIVLELTTFSVLDVCTHMKAYLSDPKYVRKGLFILVKVACFSQNLKDELFFILQFICCSSAVSPWEAAELTSPLIEQANNKGIPGDSRIFNLVYEKIFAFVDLRSDNSTYHQSILRLLRYVLTSENIRNCTEEQLKHFAAMFSGVKSPELVLDCFRLTLLICASANSALLDRVAESYFEFFFPFFPVVFSPSPGSNVSKEELQQELLQCIGHSAFLEYSVPFLLGTIDSPSTNIKTEVVKALELCTCSSKISIMLCKEIVFAFCREVIQTGCMSEPLLHASCKLFSNLSKRCAAFPSSEILGVFDWFFQLLWGNEESAQPAQCLATLLFQLLTGSWETCAEISYYILSILLVSVGEVYSCSTLLCLTSVFTGVSSSILSWNPKLSDYKTKLGYLKETIDKSIKVLANRVYRCYDDFEMCCQAECLISFLHFQLRLTGLFEEQNMIMVLKSVMKAATAKESVARRLRKLITQYAVEDLALTKLCIAEMLKDEHSLSRCEKLLVELGTTSGSAAIFICSEIAEYCKDDKAANIIILEGIVSQIEKLSAEEEQALFLTALKSGSNDQIFRTLCFLFSKASSDLLLREYCNLHNVPLVEVSALLTSGREINADEIAMLRFAELFYSSSSAAEEVTQMNGLISCFVRVPKIATSFFSERMSDKIAICFLWSCILADADPSDEQLEVCFSTIFTQNTDENSLIRIFSFVPFQALNSEKSISLLIFIFRMASYCCTIASHTQVGKIVLFLLEHADRKGVCNIALELVKFAGEHLGSRLPDLTLSVILAVNKADPENSVLLRAITDQEISSAVFCGVDSPNLLIRCATFNLLRDLKALLSTNTSTVVSREFTRCTLSSSLKALSDPKRKVRFAAAKCRHVWLMTS